MAKRTPRAEANEVAAAAPAPPRARNRAGKAATQAASAPQGAPETAGPSDDLSANDPPSREPEPSRSREPEPSEDDIRNRAYQLYIERGGQHGAHEDDWYRAEQELKKPQK